MAAAPTASDGVAGANMHRLPIKKICIVVISFIPAVAIISLSNAFIAHLFVATAVLFPSTSTPKAVANAPSPRQQKTKQEPPQAIIKKNIIYVSPTEDVIDSIQQEVESSDPLPPIAVATNDDHQRPADRARSMLISMETSLNHLVEQFFVLKNAIEDLNDAFASFMSRSGLGIEKQSDAPNAEEKVLEKILPSIQSILSRSSLKDMDRQNVMQLFSMGMEDLRWLLHAESSSTNSSKAALHINAHNTLSKTLYSVAMKKITNACEASYLLLHEGNVSVEFEPPPRIVKKLKSKVEATKPVPIANTTARESNLYDLVEKVKRALSRRDLDPNMPSPINDDGVKYIRSKISPMANNIQKKRNVLLAQESQMRDYWGGRMEALIAEKKTVIHDTGLCASSALVEGLVKGGLDTIRRKEDLRSSLVGLALSSVSEDADLTLHLVEGMKKIIMPETDYTSAGVGLEPPQHGPSSWKPGRKSISYAIEGPFLHRGLVGWIDSFVDTISGYNDYLDALIDWAVGEGGVSVGTSLVHAFSKAVRKISFPEKYAQHFQTSGILGGRAKVILGR